MEPSWGQRTDKAGEKALSKDRIILLANSAARQEGFNPEDPEKCKTVYDEANVNWRELVRGHTSPKIDAQRHAAWPPIDSPIIDEVMLQRWPHLKGRDYQVVTYWHKPPEMDGGFWVLVDRKTGEIVLATQGD
jgi:hypothetical protein